MWVPFEHDIQVLGYFLHSYYAEVDVEMRQNDHALPKKVNDGDDELAGSAPPKGNFDIRFVIEG